MAEVFQYEIDWPATGRYPGHHRSRHAGGGFEFKGYLPLLAAPVARRIDLRASLKDPFERWIVRTFRQRSAIAVYMLADLSASMGAGGGDKLNVLADFSACASESAYRTGDAFGFIGADELPRSQFFQPARRSKAVGVSLRARLRAFTPTGTSAEGLLPACAWLPRRPSLVFLVSDFHLPGNLLKSVLAALAGHHVVPVVLWDTLEFTPTAALAITAVRDAETGHRRVLVLRPRLKRALAAAYRQRYQSLMGIFAQFGARPLLLTQGFHAELVTQYFAGARPSGLLEES